MVELNIDIPSGFLDEEIRDGYRVTRKTKEVWAVEIDLLSEFDRVCNKFNIAYFADYGTLLGAVRHGGFIPWDDDVDLFMKRGDYDRLCGHSDEFIFPYFFQTEDTDPGGCRGHAQLRNSRTTGALDREKGCLGINQGIFIDIFPIDKRVDDEKKLNKQIKRIKKWKYLASFIKKSSIMPDKNPGFISLIKRIYRFIHKLLPVFDRFGDYCYRKFENECRRYNHLDTDTYIRICFPQFGKTIFFGDDICDSVRIPFEFVDIPVPIGYDDVLKRIYGDYNKLVRHEASHGNVIFDTCRDYKTVLKNEYGNTMYSQDLS